MTVQIHGKDIFGDDRYLNVGLEFDEFVTNDFTPWSTYLINTGSATQGPHQLRLFTGVTADSKASCYCPIYNAMAGLLPVGYGFFDIDIAVGWVIGMEDDVATSKTYLMYGLNHTAIDPTVEALGFRIDNLAAKGIVHDGSSLHVVDLSTTMTQNSIFGLSIVFTAGSKIEWFINGVLKGESTNIPSGTKATSYHKLSAQVTNGATATAQVVNCYKTMYRQKTWG